MTVINERPYLFLQAEYPEVRPHLDHKDAASCAQALYKADHEKGSVLFHLFQKLIARQDVLTSIPIRRFVETVHHVLNTKPLARGPASQLGGANTHLKNLLQAEAATATKTVAAKVLTKVPNRMEAIAETLRSTHPSIFTAGVDLLTAEYAEFDPKILAAIERRLHDAKGAVDELFREELVLHGSAVRSLSIQDVDLSGGEFERSLSSFSEAFPNLQRLNLANCKLNEQIVAALENHLPQLEELDISHNSHDLFCRFDTRAPVFHNLRVLHWNDSQQNAHWCAHLPKIPSLHTFSLQGAAVTQPDVLAAVSRSLPNLRELDLSRCSYDLNMHRLQFVAEFRHLKTLILRDCQLITEENIATLRAFFPHIEIIK